MGVLGFGMIEVDGMSRGNIGMGLLSDRDRCMRLGVHVDLGHAGGRLISITGYHDPAKEQGSQGRFHDVLAHSKSHHLNEQPGKWQYSPNLVVDRTGAVRNRV